MAEVKENIVVYGADWCADCHRAKYLLDKHDVAYIYKDVDSNPAIMQEMLALVDGKNIIPTIQFGDGTILQEPSNEELLKVLSLHEDSPMKQSHDVVMIGAGPAALTAAIYTTREDIDTVLFERGVVGGLAAITDMIDNYPGFPKGVEGLTLAQALQDQAERFGAVIELGDVLKIHDEGMYKRLETTSGDYFARAVLIATGSDYKKIGVRGEQEYYGRGVHYCATCDGAFYRDKKLVVVGGGNSAIQEAIFLTRFATHIDLLVRSTIKASDVLQKDLEQKVQEDKITVHLGVTTDEIVGENNSVAKVVGTDTSKKEKVEFVTDGVFIFVGLQPNNQFLDGSGIELDDVGLIKTNHRLETAIPGIFAAGDIRSGATMQIASAAGEGATAALMIREYLEDRSHPVQN